MFYFRSFAMLSIAVGLLLVYFNGNNRYDHGWFNKKKKRKTVLHLQCMNMCGATPNRKSKNLIMFTNARDERHIKEWAAHHLNLGADRLVIFDHKSTIW